MNEQSQEVVAINLDVAAFRSWLLNRCSAVVGYSACAYRCPLAKFLSSQAGEPYSVQPDKYYPVRSSLLAAPLPAWAIAFIRLLDFTHPLKMVTGEQALVLLTHVDCCSNSTLKEVCE